MLCFIVSCSNTDSRISKEVTAEIGQVAPDIVIKNVSGKDVRLSAFRGNVVLLEFWATWCPPCRASVPELVELQKKYQGRNFTVIGISVDSDSDAFQKISQFSAAYNINYPILVSDDAVQKSFNIVSVPTAFLIGKDGVILDMFRGYSEEFRTELPGKIEKLL